VSVGLPSGDAYTVLLTTLECSAAGNTGDCAGVQAFQRQSECSRYGARREIACLPTRSGDRCCLRARARAILCVGRGRLEAVLSCLATVIPHS
jgi:hypothetical protein